MQQNITAYFEALLRGVVLKMQMPPWPGMQFVVERNVYTSWHDSLGLRVDISTKRQADH
jgi:hypothetical protein